MDICRICFLDVPELTKFDHARFHKRYGHHEPYCQINTQPMKAYVMDTDPPTPCTCPQQHVYL